MTDQQGEEKQPTDREARLRRYLVTRAEDFCEYLDKEGIAKLEAGHQVEAKIVIPMIGDKKIDIFVTINARKADA